ncbi:MAG: hypothetical protein FWG71_04115 [Synergistaceae bacterium]|nr:hypothetical protein [Synergistaceae bacterium]
MAFGWWPLLMKYIWPPFVMSGVLALLGEWQRSDIKNKAILAVFFIPAMLSVGGLLVYIAHFVLFKLPSFILSVLGWLLLISLFSGGGLYCYEKISGKQTARAHDPASYVYDVTPDGKAEKDKKNWFDDVKWFRK